MENTPPKKRRYSRAFRELVIGSIIDGELFLEEAMLKYDIVDRRTIITWLRKHIREEKKRNQFQNPSTQAYRSS
jgi:transposase-like protein